MLDWTPHLRAHLRDLQLRPERSAEVIEELAQHLEQRYTELLQQGQPEAEAERLALAEVADGELPQRLRSLRQARGTQALDDGAPDRSWWLDFSYDLRHALRGLRQQPGFALVAILTLALGIGANAAIFALVDATVLRALPLPEADRVLFLSERTDASPRGLVSPLNMRDWANQSNSFEAIGGYQPNVASMVLTRPDGTGENVARQWVTSEIFDALGLQAIVGRAFNAGDDRPDNNLVVLSESFWRAQYGADPAIVGQALRLDGESFTVVGVMPRATELIGRSSIWALASFADASPRLRGAYFLNTVGRLKPGVSRAAATAELDSIADSLAREHPVSNAGRGVNAEPLRAVLVGGDLRLSSWLFLAVVGLVLLVCCANVANLLLARASARSRELAIRTALGATRSRMLRQLLTESLLLAMLGGLLGLTLGAAILAAAPALVPEGLLPNAVSLQFDLRVVGFCLIAALATGLLFGMAPAWQASRMAPGEAIGADSRGIGNRGGRLRSLLVVGQVATAVVLLFGGGLLVRTLLAVEGVDRGYEARGVLTMMVDPLGSRYPSAEQILRFYDQVAREVGDVPGVRSVAWATTLPLGASSFGDAFVTPEGAPLTDPQARPTADYQIISEAYFDTLGVPVRAGRGFDQRDLTDGVPVAIVNEAFVRKYLAAEIGPTASSEALLRAALGKRISVQLSADADAPATVREIVGVAGQLKARPDEREDFVQLYVPLSQSPVGDIFLLVRPESGSAGTLAPQVRDAIHRIDTEQLVGLRSVATLEELAWNATARHRFRAVLVAGFAGLVLVLAMIGVYGVLSYAVQQRQRDYGLRMALGAGPRHVLGLLAGSVGRLIGAGIALGIVLALVLGQALASLLFGVRSFDPLTLLAVTALLALAAVLATLAPAWRAVHVDPAVSLRGD